MGVEVTVEGTIGIVRMNWPERRNALKPEDAHEVAARISELEKDCHAIILAGTSKAFCAGADLKEIRRLIDEGGREAQQGAVYGAFQRLARTIRESTTVILAAVDGPAVGLGADLAFVCDMAFVGEAGWIDQGWARAFGVPGLGGAWLTSRRGGSHAAWKFFLSQKRWDGPALEELGLASASVGLAETDAMTAAQFLTTMPRYGVRAYKSLLRSALEEPYLSHLERCLEYQSVMAIELAPRNLGFDGVSD